MKSATTWLGIVGGIAMVLAMSKGVRGAVMIGILFVTFISWIPNHSASYLGANSPIPREHACC
jgi:AGZA family xanthine/uracil permease-like MFS transporter